MREFCESKGISQTFSAPRTPQQNGVVETKNRTLIEAARTMLEDSKLPTYFWVEAINIACFTRNISIINHAQGKIAYHQDQIYHHKESGLKVTPLNSLLVMQMKGLIQEVQLRMSVCIAAFYHRKNQRKLKMHFKIHIGF